MPPRSSVQTSATIGTAAVGVTAVDSAAAAAAAAAVMSLAAAAAAAAVLFQQKIPEIGFQGHDLVQTAVRGIV